MLMAGSNLGTTFGDKGIKSTVGDHRVMDSLGVAVKAMRDLNEADKAFLRLIEKSNPDYVKKVTRDNPSFLREGAGSRGLAHKGCPYNAS